MSLSLPETILVRAPNWIGDQILAYPFYYYLRKGFPSSKIVSVCVSWVADLQFRDLVDEVHVLPKPASLSLFDKFRAIHQAANGLRSQGPWHLGIALPNSISAAWLLYRSGVKVRRGYRVDGRGLLLNESVAWDSDPQRHRSQAYVDLLPKEIRPEEPAREFWGVPAETDLDMPKPGVLDRFDPVQAWPHSLKEVVEPPSHRYWVMAPGAQASARQWPAAYYVQLARLVHEKTGLKGVVVGSRAQLPLVEDICASADGLLNFADRGAVSSLWKIFQQASFTICNESGLAHFAALCGSPVQIICGAADPRRTQPIGPGRVQVAINPIECWPCEKNFCRLPVDQENACLKGMGPDRILEEVLSGFKFRGEEP